MMMTMMLMMMMMTMMVSRERVRCILIGAPADMVIVLWLDGFSSADWSPLPPAAHRPSVHTQWLAGVRELPPDILTPDEEKN